MSEAPLHIEHPQRPSSHLEEVLKLFRRFGYMEKDGYDEELFQEAYAMIAKEFEQADAEKRKQLLMDMYFDCVPPQYDRHGKIFEDQFVVTPPSILFESARLDEWRVSGGLLSAFTPSRLTLEPYQESRVTQYGPIKISDVLPGAWGMQNREANAIIGTSNLSACQAIIGRDRECVIVAHSLYSCETSIPEIMRQFRAKLSPDARFDFFYPEFLFGEGDAKAGYEESVVKGRNAFYEKIAKDEGMTPHGYYYVRPEHNPDDVGASTVLVGPDMMRVVGYRLAYDASARAWKRKIRTVTDYD